MKHESFLQRSTLSAMCIYEQPQYVHPSLLLPMKIGPKKKVRIVTVLVRSIAD